ncbi:MAG: serine hydroxymethyltransferase [Lachnospiraceae bacterium]|nr:serine hydroxymethyltransferase [Lachnospiraceae bacterium]
MDTDTLKIKDEELFQCLRDETARQKDTLEMVASESIQPREALLLAGSSFNNKTSTGNVGRQRLLGSQNADRIERMAAERACRVFGADYANMLTYSGTVANFCAYNAVLNFGDPVLALSHSVGAHQSHGGENNISSRLYNFRYFGLDCETLDIDYKTAERIASGIAPKLIVVGSAAYPRNIDYKRMAEIAHKSGALLMVDIAHYSGLIAAGVSPNPFPYADIVTASTTKTMCGPHSGFVMCKKEYASRIENSVYPGYVASPHLQTIAAMAYALKRSQTEEFRDLMRRVVANAKHLCQALTDRGFSVFTGGTDCHMLLLDVSPFNTDGVQFSERLEKAGISANSKSIPFEKSSIPKGVRLGTVVLTQRGMGESEMDRVADIFLLLAREGSGDAELLQARSEVKKLAETFRYIEP